MLDWGQRIAYEDCHARRSETVSKHTCIHVHKHRDEKTCTCLQIFNKAPGLIRLFLITKSADCVGNWLRHYVGVCERLCYCVCACVHVCVFCVLV